MTEPIGPRDLPYLGAVSCSCGRWSWRERMSTVQHTGGCPGLFGWLATLTAREPGERDRVLLRRFWRESYRTEAEARQAIVLRMRGSAP